jgi:DNA gyrase subunit A
MFVANTHDTVMCFSDRGKVYWLKVYQLPQAGRQARGRPLVNLLPLQDGERVTAVLPLNHKAQGQFVFMVTRQGISKKSLLKNFSRPRSAGLIAVDLADNDELVEVGLTDGESDILLFSSAGKVIRFPESHVRPMGRTARGVRGIKLKPNQAVISMLIIDSGTDEAKVLIATENGYGKRTKLADFPRKSRGGQGVIAIKVGERNGPVVGAQMVLDDDDLILITGGGRLVRTRAKEITVVGRNTQGVRLMRLGPEEQLTSLGKVVEDSGDELGSDEA